MAMFVNVPTKRNKAQDSYQCTQPMLTVTDSYTAKLLTAVRRGSVDVPTQYRHASDPHRRSKKHELRLTQYR